MRHVLLFFLLLPLQMLHPQSVWPSKTWNSAENLTAVMDAGGLTELSGLHWNPLRNRLFVVHGDGRLRILQYALVTNSFTQIGNCTVSGGPEGITQVDLSANEFYTVDEDNYEIRRYTQPADLSSASLSKHWNLLASPSPMTNTGNTGPEGIVFIPDSILSARGFLSSRTNSVYVSQKGMGGLLFIAHQDSGYVWVFDVNPNVNDDLAFVGKYATNRTESCDLSFDRSTGLLYILHNTDENSVEVCDLTTAAISGRRRFVVQREYAVPNPAGNTNIEGFTVTPRSGPYALPTAVNAFLCRDVASGESSSVQKDCLRRFTPFTESSASGVRSEGTTMQDQGSILYPNPARARVNIRLSEAERAAAVITVYNILGQAVVRVQGIGAGGIDIAPLRAGIYFLVIDGRDVPMRYRFVKL